MLQKCNINVTKNDSKSLEVLRKLMYNKIEFNYWPHRKKEEFAMSKKSGIVNVRMVITEEKILSNIDKVQKMINPNSKKQIVQLEDDTYFKDLIESIKAYLIEYPKKKNFPVSVYKAAYGLVEYATIQFEENTKKVEELIRQREENIALAGKLRELIDAVEARETGWKNKVQEAQGEFSEDVIETLTLVGKDKTRNSQNYQDALKLLNARVNNLETNLHIEIDLERTEDRSKALSYIGIEVAEALKGIPKPADAIVEETVEEEAIVEDPIIQEAEEVKTVKVAKEEKSQVVSQIVEKVEEENIAEEQEIQEYQESVTFEKKPSLWQRFKNSKLARAVTYVFKIRIRIELPNALPEGRGEE